MTTELSSFKRPGANFRSRASPSPQRASADSRPSRPLSRNSQPRSTQPRASSQGRTPVKSSSTISFRSASSGARERSISTGDRSGGRRSALGLVSEKLEARRRSASGDRRNASSSKDRWAAPAPSSTRLSTGNSNSQSRTRLGAQTNQSQERIRYRSPSPTMPPSRTTNSTSSLKRFDPTDYVRQKKEKEKERERRNSVEKKYKLAGGVSKGRGGLSGVGSQRSNSKGAAIPSNPPRGLMSASPEDRRWKSRTSSGESAASASR